MSHFGSLNRTKEKEDENECVRIKTVKSSKSRNGEEEVQEENGVLFWVNKSGFPIDNKTWERMWDHVAKIHPDSFDMVRKIRNSSELPSVCHNYFIIYQRHLYLVLLSSFNLKEPYKNRRYVSFWFVK
jgi:hypothetical protein